MNDFRTIMHVLELGKYLFEIIVVATERKIYIIRIWVSFEHIYYISHQNKQKSVELDVTFTLANT